MSPRVPEGPNRLPDRVLTLSRGFLERFPDAAGITARTRTRVEDEMAWATIQTMPDQMVLSCWYDLDHVEESMGALVELSEALTKWDRAQP